MNKKLKNLRGGMTLDEYHAELKKEGLYEEVMSRKKMQNEEVEKRVAKLRKAEAPLVEELRDIGCEVNSVWDLMTSYNPRKPEPAPYPEAIPVLLEHLDKPYPDAVLESIGRALGVPEARFAWQKIIDQYRRAEGERAKDGLADSIAIMADDDLVNDVIGLARDTTLGPSRVLLLKALVKSKNPEAHQTLRDLASDPDLEKEIAAIARKLKW